MSGPTRLPRVVADGPLNETITSLLEGTVEILPWKTALET